MTIELPDVAARHFGNSPEAVARTLIEKAALQEYRSGSISIGRLGEILGMSFWETGDFLDKHKARQPYTAEMLEEDQKLAARFIASA